MCILNPSCKMVGVVLMIVSFVLPVSGLTAIKILKNDSYTEGGLANAQAGFISGETMAARFNALPGDYPYKIMKVKVLVADNGSGGINGDFTLHIWEDNGSLAPGDQVITPQNYSLTSGFMNEIDLLGSGPIVTEGTVRVGLTFLQDPMPTFATDNDGIADEMNLINAAGLGWRYAESFGVSGDFIIRIEIDTNQDPPTATPTPFVSPTPPPPTNTPIPTFTTAPSAIPTSTPSGIPEVNLWMPAQYFTPADPCGLRAYIQNPGTTIGSARLIVMMILGEGVWFWPSWQQRLDSQLLSVGPGESEIVILPNFEWPSGVGSYSPIIFIGALTDSGYQEFIAMPDLWNFGFGE